MEVIRLGYWCENLADVSKEWGDFHGWGTCDTLLYVYINFFSKDLCENDNLLIDSSFTSPLSARAFVHVRTIQNSHNKEQTVMQMKVETWEIYRMILTFDKTMRIRRVRWNSNRAQCHPHPNALFDLFTVNPAEDWDRITVPETSFERFVLMGTEEVPASKATSDRPWAKIRSPSEFVISLRA
jgi:hypothetical protein